MADNSRILVISDLHFPYGHRDAIRFLDAVANQFSVTRVINIGDEVDGHAWSFHEHDPDLLSPGAELANARVFVRSLGLLFPDVDLLDSNHGSLIFRRAKAHGLPAGALKTYGEALLAPSGWKWHGELVEALPDGSLVCFRHGMSKNPLTWAQSIAMHTVNGHFHETFEVRYWKTPRGLFWSMVVGCLIDDSSLAYAYNKLNVRRPVLGVGLIVNSLPLLVPMRLRANGRWSGRFD